MVKATEATNGDVCDFCSQVIDDEELVVKSGGLCCPDCLELTHFQRRLIQELLILNGNLSQIVRKLPGTTNH